MNTIHLGRNIIQIRDLLGIKQETLASRLGYSQQTISRIEQSKDIDDDKLEKIGEALGVTAQGIKNFNKESVINHINNFNDNSKVDTLNQIHTQNQINPLDKIIELYERLLAKERGNKG